ncbi:hypothetical protein ACOSP7_016948 [Xanthoceras sorbifolium]
MMVSNGDPMQVKRHSFVSNGDSMLLHQMRRRRRCKKNEDAIVTRRIEEFEAEKQKQWRPGALERKPASARGPKGCVRTWLTQGKARRTARSSRKVACAQAPYV